MLAPARSDTRTRITPACPTGSAPCRPLSAARTATLDRNPGGATASWINAANAAEFTVSELALAVKRTVEDAFGYVRVRGEISGYRGQHSSGHAYFSLKDADASIDAVIWKTSLARMRFKPRGGAGGHRHRAAHDLPALVEIPDRHRADGAGRRRRADGAARGAAQEARSPRGCSTAARKKPLPYLPRVIGVVTSPTGAVIRDILHRLDDRFPSHVLRLAGARAGRDLGGRSRRGHRGLQRCCRRAARSRGPTC